MYFIDIAVDYAVVGMEFSNKFILAGGLSTQFFRFIGNRNATARSFGLQTSVIQFNTLVCFGLVSVLFLQGFGLYSFPYNLDIFGTYNMVYW